MGRACRFHISQHRHKSLQSGKRNLWARSNNASRLFVHPLVAYALLGIGGFRMTDRGFYLLLGLLILALAGAEVVYAMVGPLSEPTQQDD